MLGLLIAATLQTSRPTLRFERPEIQTTLGTTFERALDNLLAINTVPFDAARYNRTGLLKGSRFARAGGGYDQPWTRDAAINSWNAASLLEPEVARDTLWAATLPDEKGEPIVQRDSQWWDKVVWIVGAWNHYRTTGDRAFLATGYGVAERLLREMRATRYNATYGLFQGPSFFNDGIAGYPSPPAEANDGGSSFVLDHRGADRLMPLSTNCLYVGAYRAAGEMARELRQPSKGWDEAADALRKAIDRRFWIPGKGTYGYLLDDAGKLDDSQEGGGLAFAILFDVASPSRARTILRNAHREPFGIVDVWPPFARFSDERPGRHNNVVWPMIQGMWARAATKLRDADALQRHTEDLARLVRGGHFFEIYDAKTGLPNGGWQNGRPWDSAPDQTWSATAYLSMVLNGPFGLRFERAGLRFEPLVPKAWGGATLSGLRYRGAVLDVRLRGSGSKAVLTLDGAKVGLVPSSLTGRYTVEIAVR